MTEGVCMNPLKKDLLGIMTGVVIALFSTPDRSMAILSAPTALFVFYSIGLIYGWKVVTGWAGKVLRLGTDLTFWVFFACLFRRGFLIGTIVLLLFFSIVIGVGCWVGIFYAVVETVKYLFGNREAWKKKTVFPTTDAAACVLLMAWFGMYNRQNVSEEDVQNVLDLFPGQQVDVDEIVHSLNGRNVNDLYQAVLRYEGLGRGEEGVSYAALLLAKLMELIQRSGRLICQAQELLIVLAERRSTTWQALESAYRQTMGEPCPEVRDPSQAPDHATHGNDRKTREALRTLGLPEDFDLERSGAEEEIHQAYRRKARQHHPDLNPEEDGKTVAGVIKAFNFLQEELRRRGTGRA